MKKEQFNQEENLNPEENNITEELNQTNTSTESIHHGSLSNNSGFKSYTKNL